jgi:hypothetical protein
MSARAFTWPLGGATALMAALALAPWIAGGPTAPTLPHAPGEAAVPRLAALPPFAAYAEIAARPLFLPSRRPNAEAAAAGIETRYRLLGIVIAGSERHALLAPVAGGPGIELAPGGSLDGWKAARIEADSVVLTSPAGHDATIGLKPLPTKR